MHAASYVEGLQRRVQLLEDIIRKRCPDVDLSRLDTTSNQEASPSSATPGPGTPLNATSDANIPSSSRGSPALLSTMPFCVVPRSPLESEGESSSDAEDMGIQESVVEGLSKLSLDPVTRKYQGKSSGLVFMRPAVLHAEERTSEKGSPGSRSDMSDEVHAEWKEPQPEAEITPFREFPPPDLIEHLTQLYFREINVYTPLLHEPTFRESVRMGEHFRDGGFGAVVLLICANGARDSDDPRVFEEGTTSRLSRGWKWFKQVETRRKSLLAPSRLYDLQISVLMTTFVQGSGQILHSWNVNGLGLRRALELGVHRKRFYSATPTVEGELWRRAFWALVVTEWAISHAFGRPCMLDEEELDVPLPIECDDEYWVHDDAERAFKQPPGKPSKVAYFNSTIRLTRILAYATRTVYGIRKSQARFGQGEQQWQERVVAELDSSLNKWADSVPAHLKWDPHREDELFLRQSATLHGYFYLVQVAVHRAFILPGHRSPLSFPSLIICTNACRACIQVLYGLYKRIGTPLSRNLGTLYMCGLVLFYKRWSNKRAGYSPAADPDLEYVQKCLELIKAVQVTQPTAHGVWELMHRLLEEDNGPSAVSPEKQPSGTDPASTTNLHTSPVASDSRPPPNVAQPTDGLPNGNEFGASAFTVGSYDSASMLTDAPLPLHLDELRQTPAGSFGAGISGANAAAAWQGVSQTQAAVAAAAEGGAPQDMPIEFQMLFHQGADVAGNPPSGMSGMDMGTAAGPSHVPPMFHPQAGQGAPAPGDPNVQMQDLFGSLGWVDWDQYTH
ncbi:fungal-specific transcription factor domain-containing protein [Trametes polyzona]|nr:fungal-specific transcription factor domain-containing protein [Trametes polyzona]